MTWKLVIFLSLISIVGSIFLDRGGGGGGGYSGGYGGGGRFDSHSHSHSNSHSHSHSHSHSSSHSHEHRHGGRRHHHRPPRSLKCEEGYTEFSRPNGKWCLKAVMANTDASGAQQVCSSQGAVLSGYQNSNERVTMADIAQRMIMASGIRAAGMWLGATGPANMIGGVYTWTDGSTTGTEGFYWGPSQPDLNGPCVHQFILTPQYWSTRPLYGFSHADIDNYPCQKMVEPPVRMALCGRKPSVR